MQDFSIEGKKNAKIAQESTEQYFSAYLLSSSDCKDLPEPFYCSDGTGAKLNLLF
jgi:hypothetical protein